MHIKPFISFYIPTYNRAKYLHDTVMSLVTQSSFDLQTMELVICDDASTDNTEDVVKKLQKKHSNIHYIRNDRNLGIDGNIHKAFVVCSGKYIWIMGDDDLLYPKKLSIVLDAIQHHPDAYIFQLNYDHYDKEMTTCRKKNIMGIPKNTTYFPHLKAMYAYADYNIEMITYMGIIFRNDIGHISNIHIPESYFPQSCIKSLLHEKPMVIIGESIVKYRTNHSDFGTAYNLRGIYNHRKIWIIGYPVFVRFCYTNKVAVDYIKLSKPYVFIIKWFITLICVLVVRKLGLYDIILPRWRKSIFNIFD